MNEIRISGVLEAVTEQSSGTGSFLTARLRFSRNDEIVLLAAGEKVRAFGPFDAGDSVRIVGRLAVANGGLVVLVDECCDWHRESRARRREARVECEY